MSTLSSLNSSKIRRSSHSKASNDTANSENQMIKIKERVKKIISLNPNINSLPTKSSTVLCGQHPKSPAVYENSFLNILQCEKCAINSTMSNPSVNITSDLAKDEFKKKNKSDAFMRRLQFYEVCLNGHLERNERIMNESVQRHAHDVNRINVFFEHISSIFHEVYTKLIGDKTSKIEIIKHEHENKRGQLVKNIESVNRFHIDIANNYENIIFGMKNELFTQIIENYTAEIDKIQEFCEDNQTDNFTSYNEILDNPRKIEDVNNQLQKIIAQLYKMFDKDEEDFESSKSDDRELEDTIISQNIENSSLNEELSKINECFYSSTLKNVKENAGKF